MTDVNNIIQAYFVDSERVSIIRETLIKAYTKKERTAVKSAALMAQQYINEGGDINYEIDEELEEYRGDDPTKLADMYFLRLLHDRHLDNDEDQQYIETGWPEPYHTIRCAKRDFTFSEWCDYCESCHADTRNRIITSIGKYDFNDHDVCLNPETLTIATQPHAYYVTLRWCYCGNGIWNFGVDYSYGNGGGGLPCSYTDTTDGEKKWLNGYKSESEAIFAACDRAICNLQHSGEKKHPKVVRLIQMVEEHKRTIAKPQPIQLSLFGDSDF